MLTSGIPISRSHVSESVLTGSVETNAERNVIENPAKSSALKPCPVVTLAFPSAVTLVRIFALLVTLIN